MAGTSVLKLKVDDKEYNSSLKQAQQGLQHLGQALNNAGKSFTQVDKTVVDYVRSIGQMEAQSKTARGRIGEMSNAFVEFSLQYKKMSDEVKNSDVGKALAESIEQLKNRTIDAKEELDELNKSLNNVKMPEDKGGGLFSGLGDKMSGAMQVFAGNMLTKAAGAVANLGSEIFSSVQQGVELARQGEGIRIAFERLGRGDILDGLREATHGTVTDLELMKAAVKFNDFKLPVEELGTMLAFAQQKAKDTGQSVDYMVDSIVTGLGRKSLMILDNLGLSATEVKNKMAETGDMTKAVGEIIREQMSKAGDYVETAADRAAQANVNLQNKMEELGRKFAPLEEASSQLWTSMKIGILDIIGGPLTDLLNKLTEAGRLASAYGVLGGNAKVGRMTANLSSARDGNRQSIYQQQQQQFWKYINPREQQIRDIRAWQSGQRGEALQGRISAITEKYGSLDVTKIQAEVDAAKKMLADYQSAAKQILSPVKAVIDTSGAGQSIDSLKVKLAELEAQRKKAIAAGDTDLSKNLAKQITQVKSDIKGLGGSTTVKTQKNLPEYADFNKQLFKSMSGDDLKQEIPHLSVFETFKNQAKFDPENILGSKDAWEEYKDTIAGSIGSIGESMSNFTQWTADFDPYKQKMDEVTKAAKQQQMAMGLAANAVGSFSQALAGMDDPAAKAAGTVMQAIASIALGFATASAQANTAGTGWGWLAWIAAGMSAMATTIATVHSLTGYAQGGMIKGNSYSGDNIGGLVDGNQLVGLNAGEVVLNAAQQNTLAQSLQGNAPTVRVVGKISGTDIILSADRTLMTQGKQLAVWGM